MLNSQSTILHDPEKNEYYLNVMDGWLQAPDLVAGPWTYASKIPDDMKEITKGIQERQQAKAAEGTAAPSLKQAKKEGKIPEIYLSMAPAELLVTEGAPQFELIPDTELEYVKNTTGNIFKNVASLDYYILIAGRWFRSKSLESGPWEFVEGQNLPEKFAHIPENSPKAGVLVSVPGTGPAKEALIANAIPQTATITRSQAQLEVEYDGEPQFKNIEGTNLQYAVNTATPVIRVDDKNYYAVANAVWFVGAAPVGPWAVATSVPAAIYCDSSQFLSALRYLCEGLPLHAGCCLPGLHSRVLRNGRVFQFKYGCVRHWLLLSALHRQLLVWRALHVRSRRGLYVEFGYGLEHHDRRWLHVWLSLLLLSVVGAMGILRTMLLGTRLGIRLRRLCQRERIRSLGQCCVREYGRCLGESIHRKLRWGKPHRFPKHAARHRGSRWSRRQYQHLHGEHCWRARSRGLQSADRNCSGWRRWIRGQHL